MICSDVTIREQIAQGRIRIEPAPEDWQYQPASIDLTLDNEFQSPYSDKKIVQDSYLVGAGDCVLATTAQTIEVPHDMVARVEGKSTWGRKFLMVHATAGFIDPGFFGSITLELINLSRVSQVVRRGSPIAQISFEWVDVPVARPYGTKALGSHYQYQQGVTPSASPWT